MKRRILIIRLSALGDIVFASSLVPVFRNNFPNAQLSWLVAEPYAPLLSDEPMLDEVIVLPTAHWRRMAEAGSYLALVRSIGRYSKSLRRRRFDLTVDLQGLLKSGLWAKLIPAHERVGLGSREGSQLFMDRVIDRHGGDSSRIASEYLHFARQMGMSTDDFSMRLSVSLEAKTRADDLISPFNFKNGYAVVCPFTTRPQKHWVDEHWVALISRLQSVHASNVFILGGPSDVEQADGLAAASGAISLAGKTSIQEAAAIIENAQYVIGVDTGLTHMGIAFDRPTLCLFGSTRPYINTATPNARVIYQDLSCAPCRRHPTCDGRFDCMRTLLPSMVLDNLGEMLRRAA
jgi:heptosyltransferase-1